MPGFCVNPWVEPCCSRESTGGRAGCKPRSAPQMGCSWIRDRIVQEDEGSMAEENRIFGELALQTKEVGLSFLEA